MHPNPHQRRTIIEENIDAKSASIIEIGALNAPTFSPADYDIKFIDYTTRDQLIEDNKGNPAINPDKIVHVDYPIMEPEYSKHIPERFDLAIANHVIEHVPDMVRWFKEVAAILNVGGLFFLSVPDRRYTFDYLKRPSDIVDIMRAYLTEETKPTAATLFQHYYYRRPLSAEDCWNGAYKEKIAQPGMPLKDALFNAVRASKIYTSTHCHIFTTETFKELVSQLQELELIDFEIADIRDVDPGSNEFHVLLRKR